MNQLFYFMARNGKQTTRISLNPKQIENVYIGQQRIFLKTVQGCYYVNQYPTPKERSFWTYYKSKNFSLTYFPYPKVVNKPERWDMASPDALAISSLESYEELK